MIIVSDTTTITYLFQLGKLDLLRALYGHIHIPEAVANELATQKDQKMLLALPWISVHTIPSSPLLDRLITELDRGEAEAIAFSRDYPTDVLIIDERKGRQVAKLLGIKTIGLLGVLLDAKRQGYIPRLKEIIDKLRLDYGFRISTQLYDVVLEKAEE